MQKDVALFLERRIIQYMDAANTKGKKMLKVVEFVGVLCGIIGSFAIANGFMMAGYPLFLVSSACLLFSAFRQANKNLMLLQFVFLCANINGTINFVL